MVRGTPSLKNAAFDWHIPELGSSLSCGIQNKDLMELRPPGPLLSWTFQFLRAWVLGKMDSSASLPGHWGYLVSLK